MSETTREWEGCTCGFLNALLERSASSEQAIEVEGMLEGHPFYLIVCVGANAGLMKKYAHEGSLKLVKEDLGGNADGGGQ